MERTSKLKANGDIFEEFSYNLDSMSVVKIKPEGKLYTVGDEIPVHGASYEYPEYFDIVVLRDKVAVKVREKKVTAIEPLNTYEYTGVPVINGRGFEVLVKNAEETKEFLAELEQEGEELSSEFFNKWLKFETYRKIVFKNEVWEE